MRWYSSVILALSLSLFVAVASSQAADQWYEFPAQSAMTNGFDSGKLHSGIKLYMKGQAHPAAVKTLGTYKSNKRANAFMKSKETACETAFLSALIALQERAQREGGNAVIDIYSVTRNENFSSPDQFRCVSGNMVSNVVLMGTVAKLP